jgi:hypothetical protein
MNAIAPTAAAANPGRFFAPALVVCITTSPLLLPVAGTGTSSVSAGVEVAVMISAATRLVVAVSSEYTVVLREIPDVKGTNVGRLDLDNRQVC